MKKQIFTFKTLASICRIGILIVMFSSCSDKPTYPIPISDDFSNTFQCKTDPVYLQTIETVDSTSASNISTIKGLTLDSARINQATIGISILQDSLRVIPVVFHVVHQCGMEKVKMPQIQNAIEDLNKDFHGTHIERLQDPDDPFLDAIGTMDNIEFRLASIDPYGNATKGVHFVEHFSSINGSGLETELKKYVQWPPDQYLNVWVINSTGGSAYAHYPWTADGRPWADGIVISHNYLGTTGTSEAWKHRRRKILTHEVGHWLGLRHTWGDNPSYLAPGNPNSCPIGDDGIDDTPRTAGSSAILYPYYPNLQNMPGLHNPDAPELGLSFLYKNVWNAAKQEYYPSFYDLNPNSSADADLTPVTTSNLYKIIESHMFPKTCNEDGFGDNVYNFMDYGCEIMFTRGQINFMQLTLMDTVANRHKIGRNLEETFILNPKEYTMLTVDNYFFQESDENDGSIKNEITLNLSNGKWGAAWANGADNITAENLPSGLEIEVEKINDTISIIRLVGNALAHSDANDINTTFTLKISGVQDICSLTHDKPYWRKNEEDTGSDDVIYIKGLTVDFKDEGTQRYTIYKKHQETPASMCVTNETDNYIGFGLGIYRYLDLYAHKHESTADEIRPEGFYLTKEGGSKVEVVSLATGPDITLLNSIDNIDLVNLNNNYQYQEVTRGVEENMLAIQYDTQSLSEGIKYIGLRFTFDCAENYYYGWLRINLSKIGTYNQICLMDSYYDANPNIPTFRVGEMECEGNVVNASSGFFIEQVSINKGRQTLLNTTSSSRSSDKTHTLTPTAFYNYKAQLPANSVLNVSLKSKYPTSPMHWWIYIDKNEDGIFDLTEQVFYKYGKSDPAVTGSFTSHSTLTSGYKMRIVSSLYKYDAHFNEYVLSPCGSISQYGSILDINVGISL